MCYTEECDCSYPYDETPDVEPKDEGAQFDLSYLKELVDCEAADRDGHIQIFTQWWNSEGRLMTRPFSHS